MENLKAIRERIKTIDSIIKATNAMKMVSNVKLTRVNNINKHSKECSEILFDMFKRATTELLYEQNNEYWFSNKVSHNDKPLIIVLSVDQGFCGAFQQAIQNKAKEIISTTKNAYVETFGKKSDSLANANLMTSLKNSHYDISANAKSLTELVSRYVKEFFVSDVYIVSGEFKSVLVQKAQCKKIYSNLSETNKDGHKEAIILDKLEKTPYSSIEGNEEDFINELFDMYLQKLFSGILTEHLVSELSARVMAMDNSVRNAKNMYEKLSGLYNKVRQAKITQELTEIVASIECVQ